MTTIVAIATGMMLALVGDWLRRFWRRADEVQQQANAARVLEAHGLTAYTYLASMGTENVELRMALDRVSFTGQIVLDRNGNIVGRVLPKMGKGPHLRLVVDNTQ